KLGGSRICCRGHRYFWSNRCEELNGVCLNVLPRWIAEHAVESASRENLRAGQVPVEEPVLHSEAFELGALCGAAALGIFLQPANRIGRDRIGRSAGVFRPDEGGAPGVGHALRLPVVLGNNQAMELFGLALDVIERSVRSLVESPAAIGK